MAKAYLIYEEYGFSSQDELDAAVTAARENLQKSTAELKSFDAKIKERKELQGWLLKYVKTRDVYRGLNSVEKEKDRDAYKQKHEADFIIHEAALRYFKQKGINKLPTYKAIQAEIEMLIAEKNAAYNTYCSDRDRFKELQTIQQNLAHLRNEPTSEKTQKQEQII